MEDSVYCESPWPRGKAVSDLGHSVSHRLWGLGLPSGVYLVVWHSRRALWDSARPIVVSGTDLASWSLSTIYYVHSDRWILLSIWWCLIEQLHIPYASSVKRKLYVQLYRTRFISINAHLYFEFQNFIPRCPWSPAGFLLLVVFCLFSCRQSQQKSACRIRTGDLRGCNNNIAHRRFNTFKKWYIQKMNKW